MGLGYKKETSPKLIALTDMLSPGGDLHGDKVIVFTRFKEMVNIAITALTTAQIDCVRITGDESATERIEAAEKFQDPQDPTRVIFITMAGGEALNLQAAKALVFYDTPWSAGDYLQIVGRMIRLGSEHSNCYVVHLLCRDTIDEYVQEVVQKKMALIEEVLGKRLKRADSQDTVVDAESEVTKIYDKMVAAAEARRKK